LLKGRGPQLTGAGISQFLLSSFMGKRNFQVVEDRQEKSTPGEHLGALSHSDKNRGGFLESSSWLVGFWFCFFSFDSTGV
jgi:hypothetical protein